MRNGSAADAEPSAGDTLRRGYDSAAWVFISRRSTCPASAFGTTSSPKAVDGSAWSRTATASATSALFDVDDPDACRYSIPLNDDEAAALADVLGASVMLSRLTSLSDETAGLYTEQIALPTDSPYLNRTLGDTKARTRTHASIVAIVRDKDDHPLPDARRAAARGRRHRRRRHS